MRFVDVKNDVAFRKIFGNEKKTFVLISFLNAILNLKNEKQITEITILNPFQLPRVAGEKATIIDVRAKDQTGRKFIIEMQVSDVKGFDKRVQYYTSREYSTQIDTGEKYKLLQPAYFVGVLDFNFFESPHYISHHIIMDGKTYEHKLKDIKFTFIELKKFNLKMEELQTLEEKWIFFIKNAKNLEVIPDNVDDDSLIEAYKEADKHSWTKEELTRYDNACIAEQDAIGRIEAAEEKAIARGMKEGMEKGMEKGMEEGMEKKTVEIALNAIQKGYSNDIIKDLTGLSDEEIDGLRQSRKK